MKKIVAYLIVFLIVIVVLAMSDYIWNMPVWYFDKLLFFKCSYIGAIGGILYSLRAVYLSKCIRKNWEDEWEVWYYLRPIASTISGFISCIFLKAGLLILDAEPKSSAHVFGYLAIAFVAGYNVSNFLKKIESVACEIWGINKSRVFEDIREGEKRGEPK